MKSNKPVSDSDKDDTDPDNDGELLSPAEKDERRSGVPRRWISDGFGTSWEALCPTCGTEIEIVRPGKVQCSRCGH